MMTVLGTKQEGMTLFETLVSHEYALPTYPSYLPMTFRILL